MYIHYAQLENIKSTKELKWEVALGKEAGWHVLIGDNGSGKSTFLRAIALALVSVSDASALRQNWNDWLKKGESKGQVHLAILPDNKLDKFAGKGRSPAVVAYGIAFFRQNGVTILEKLSIGGKDDPDKHIGSGKQGWFSVAYGPFRRFAGGDKNYEKIFYSNPRLAAHLSVFGEDVALTECLEWLRELSHKKLEKKEEGKLLDKIIEFVNQDGFLPYSARLHQVSSDGVEFVDGNGSKLLVEELSDGYRSVLSMTFEMIRQLSRAYDLKHIFDSKNPKRINAPGIVLIDEVDAHLHPTWQRKVGVWFREHFPNIQFIVTTHSPLVCQAAEHGTVFQLPKPGSKEKGRMIEGEELNRLLYGNVLDAYGTELFGENVTRSEESKKRMQRLAELNSKELQGKLTAAEKKEQKELRATLPTTAHTTK
jgi:predicted ATPase